MNVRMILSASTLAIATLGATAFAQTTPVAPPAPAPQVNTPAIDHREDHQDSRISSGRKDGELTKKERVRLHGEQKLIDRKQKKFEKDGVVTDKENKRLDHMQNKASQDIHKQRNDKQAPASK